jgi:hypothetical protein
MFRLSAVVILIALAPGGAFAQRHSGDSPQNYHPKPSNPILILDDQTTKK